MSPAKVCEPVNMPFAGRGSRMCPINRVLDEETYWPSGVKKSV